MMRCIESIEKVYRARSVEDIRKVLVKHYSRNWVDATVSRIQEVFKLPSEYPCLVLLVSTIDDEPLWGSGTGCDIIYIENGSIYDI
jgi:hypothetical protein